MGLFCVYDNEKIITICHMNEQQGKKYNSYKRCTENTTLCHLPYNKHILQISIKARLSCSFYNFSHFMLSQKLARCQSKFNKICVMISTITDNTSKLASFKLISI